MPLFAPVVLASLVGVTVSFPVPTAAFLSIITSLGPVYVYDGEVVDKEEGWGRSHVMRGHDVRQFKNLRS